ncbi:MAG: T9SS type A sorting domain-containing protein, partial [Candidatus Cloacimonetes bacterium]|nr:T9SS type A sorting domain-containing protein [Candidatus Cloacimonadota bacterium]
DGSNWQIETVDYGDAGWYSSLALDSYGYPHISHHGQGCELCYVEWDGTAWTSEIVPTGSFPVETSLALDNFDYPHISFLGYNDLMYASAASTGIQEQNYPESNTNQIAILLQNRPNPFNPSGSGRSPQTTISYKLSKSSRISLNIYNIKGELVETLVNKMQQAGNHSVVWNAENISSGIYFYRITAGNYSETKKCVILK